MKKEHIDNELYDILHFTPEVTPETQNKIDAAYEQIRSQTTPLSKRAKKKRPYLYVAAALIFAFGIWGFSNPAFAGKIPFIGRIFMMVEDNIGYSGKFSENAVPITSPETAAESSLETDKNAQDNTNTETSENDINTYSQTVGDVTITLSEVSCTELALYFSLELYSEEGFPEDFSKLKNMEDYILSYDFLYFTCNHSFDFSQADPNLYNTGIFSSEQENCPPTPHMIEGNYVDSHTFLGVIRVGLEAPNESVSYMGVLPPEFTYTLTITRFWDDINETKDVTLDSGEVIKQRVKKYYEGPWTFTIPVSSNLTDTQRKEIMETNADGIGISTVTKTPYEIKANILLPEGTEAFEYIVVITDADDKLLDYQGQYVGIYSVYGRNTDTVHIYVVGDETFMNCIGKDSYPWSEVALFQTTVEWAE